MSMLRKCDRKLGFSDFTNEMQMLDQLISKSLYNRIYRYFLDALDIDLYNFLKGVDVTNQYEIYAEMPLSIASITSDKLKHCLISDILNISNHEYYPGIIRDSFLANYLKIKGEDLPSLQSIKQSKIMMDSQEERATLKWFSVTAWPWGFAAVLNHLSLLYLFGLYNLSEKKEYEKYVTFSSFSARTWPRMVQMRYLGLREFESGKTEAPPHLIEDLTFRNSFDVKENILDFVDMGYSVKEAKELTNGGLIGIKASKIADIFIGAADQNKSLASLGGYPIEEFNPINLPKDIAFPLRKQDRRFGLFIDKYYQTPFFARKPKDYALFGANKVFRDHYDNFRRHKDIVGSVRAKHYEIPILEVGNLDELNSLIDQLPHLPDTQICFRGQTRPYFLEANSSS